MDRNERERKRKIRKAKGWTVFLIILFLIGVVIFALKAPLFDVSEYIVTGSSYYNGQEICSMGNCKTGGNIFIGTDLGDIKTRLLKDPYMENVKLKRKLPHTIEIIITERVQTAGVVYGDGYVVIDHEGIVLRRTSVDPEVTIIKGMTIASMELGETIEVEESVQLRQCMDLINLANGSNMYFKAVEIKDGEIIAHVLDNLMVQGTVDNVTNALEDESIQLVVQELFNEGIERGKIKVSGDNYVSFTPKLD